MSAWKSYVARSLEHFRDRSAEVLRAQPIPLSLNILPLLSLNSQLDLNQFAKGCDSDIGGKSIVNLDLGPEGKGRFWGRLDNELRAGRRKEGVIERGGYAGIRSKSRTTIFGPRTWDTSLHDYLRLRVKSSGDGMRYFVNIQTDGPVQSDLFQHRLWLPTPLTEETPHEFTNIIIPLSEFTLTNSGDLSELQISMLRSRVRTIGISCLVGGSKIGRFELGIEKIDCVTKAEAEEEGLVKSVEQLKAEEEGREKLGEKKVGGHVVYQMEGEMPEGGKRK